MKTIPTSYFFLYLSQGFHFCKVFMGSWAWVTLSPFLLALIINQNKIQNVNLKSITQKSLHKIHRLQV